MAALQALRADEHVGRGGEAHVNMRFPKRRYRATVLLCCSAATAGSRDAKLHELACMVTNVPRRRSVAGKVAIAMLSEYEQR